VTDSYKELTEEDIKHFLRLQGDILVLSFKAYRRKIAWFDKKDMDPLQGKYLFHLVADNDHTKYLSSYVEEKHGLLVVLDYTHPNQIGITTEKYLEGLVTKKDALKLDIDTYDEFMRNYKGSEKERTDTIMQMIRNNKSGKTN
jgi:hypothetical protein